MRDSTGSNSTHVDARTFAASPFYAALGRALARRGLSIESVCDLGDPVVCRLLTEYGAMFLAADSVRVPHTCLFSNPDEVEDFQRRTEISMAVLGGAVVELQPAALAALLAARTEAQAAGLDITPRGGTEAARRTYADTLRLWASRVEPALTHWQAQGCVTADEVARVRALAPAAQTEAVLALEARGLYCSKDFAKSILYSVAAPGASQHLALIAFDVVEFTNDFVRTTLARHGWFQTVRSDLPHFTFLGVREKNLPGLGLKRVEEWGQIFWVPAVI